MSVNFENHLCYFCDETYPYPSCFILNYNELWVCHNCDFILINYNNKENDVFVLKKLHYINYHLAIINYV